MLILHATLDGLLQPLGFSQVARPSLALARRGLRPTLLSLERPADLSRAAALQRQLADGGVTWRYGEFHAGGSPRIYARNVATLIRLAGRETPDVGCIRAFPAGPLGLWLRGRGVPFVYDIRGYWVDQRAADDAWPRPAIALARVLDASYYRACAAAVSLTAIGARDIANGRFAKWPAGKPALTIPTCVDYDDFTLADRPRRLVLGFVGSINKDYLADDALKLVSHVCRLRSDARLLIVSEQHAAVRALAEKHGVPGDRIEAKRATHDEMPRVLHEIDWGLLLLRRSEVKRASMPTKLGEFFAAGVRPVHYGCNDELAEWVARTGSGFTLPALDDRSLEQAAQHIADAAPASLQHAREIAEPHFSLRAGVERYAELFARIKT